MLHDYVLESDHQNTPLFLDTMADLLADVRMRPRFTARNQTSFLRALKSLSQQGNIDNMNIRFNIPSLIRLHDMNPDIYVSALLLLDAGVAKDPKEIREHHLFPNLLEGLGIRSTSTEREAKNSHRASLVLLEVFTYMIIIDRARLKEEGEKSALASGNINEQEELTV